MDSVFTTESFLVTSKNISIFNEEGFSNISIFPKLFMFESWEIIIYLGMMSIKHECNEGIIMFQNLYSLLASQV